MVTHICCSFLSEAAAATNRQQHQCQAASVTCQTESLSGCGRRVLRAFPVKELVTEDDTINAEMDPEDVFRVTETIQGHHQMT